MFVLKKIGSFVGDYIFDTIGDGLRKIEKTAKKENKELSSAYYRRKSNYQYNKQIFERFKRKWLK